MNERKLIKELGYKSTMRIRDYYMSKYDEIGHFELKEYLDIKEGDVIVLISIKSTTKSRFNLQKYLDKINK